MQVRFSNLLILVVILLVSSFTWRHFRTDTPSPVIPLPSPRVTLDGEEIFPVTCQVGSGWIVDLGYVGQIGQVSLFCDQSDSTLEFQVREQGLMLDNQLVAISGSPTTIDADQRGALRCATVSEESQLEGLNLERCVVICEQMEPTGHLPFVVWNIDSLPSNRYLAELAGTRYLKIAVTQPDKLDLGNRRGLTTLEALYIYAGDIAHPELILSNPNLHTLDISGTPKVSKVDFLSSNKALRSVNLGGTSVTDLSSLAGLGELEDLDISSTLVANLPENGFPKLKALRVTDTPLSKSSIDRFKNTHPDCKLTFSLIGALQQRVADATRLRVRDGGTCHRDLESETTLYETSDKNKISDFINILEENSESQATWEALSEIRASIPTGSFRSDLSMLQCMCCGYPTIEFYEDKALITTLGIQHGVALRWMEWSHDVNLSNDSGKRLVAWLKDNGVQRID